MFIVCVYSDNSAPLNPFCRVDVVNAETGEGFSATVENYCHVVTALSDFGIGETDFTYLAPREFDRSCRWLPHAGWSLEDVRGFVGKAVP